MVRMAAVRSFSSAGEIILLSHDRMEAWCARTLANHAPMRNHGATDTLQCPRVNGRSVRHRLSRRDVFACGLGAAAVLGARPGWAGMAADFVEALRRNMTQWNVPGASYALLRKGRISAGAVGVRRNGGTEPVTPETMFQAASLSKTIAAVAALVLVQREKLAIDTEINSCLTTWKLPVPAFAEGRAVTLRRLLGMTGGINVPGFIGYKPGAVLPTELQILDGLPPANSPPIRITEPPGTKQIYSGG